MVCNMFPSSVMLFWFSICFLSLPFHLILIIPLFYHLSLMFQWLYVLWKYFFSLVGMFSSSTDSSSVFPSLPPSFHWRGFLRLAGLQRSGKHVNSAYSLQTSCVLLPQLGVRWMMEPNRDCAPKKERGPHTMSHRWNLCNEWAALSPNSREKLSQASAVVLPESEWTCLSTQLFKPLQ